jgi:hypothetical protein
VRRNSALAAAALAAALAACQRAPEEPPKPAQPGISLDAPAPSRTIVTSPLTKGATGYTNEMQAAYLQDQAAALGIARLTQVSHLGSEAEGAPAQLSTQEGLDRTRELEREFAAQRRSIDRGKPKTVDLSGATPQLLQPSEAAPGGTPTPQ